MMRCNNSFTILIWLQMEIIGSYLVPTKEKRPQYLGYVLENTNKSMLATRGVSNALCNNGRQPLKSTYHYNGRYLPLSSVEQTHGKETRRLLVSRLFYSYATRDPLQRNSQKRNALFGGHNCSLIGRINKRKGMKLFPNLKLTPYSHQVGRYRIIKLPENLPT